MWQYGAGWFVIAMGSAWILVLVGILVARKFFGFRIYPFD